MKKIPTVRWVWKNARPNASYLTKLKVKKGDFLIFLLLAGLTAIQFFFFPNLTFSSSKAVVYREGKVLKIVDLSRPHEEKVFYKGKLLMIFKIDSKGLKVTSSSCPDKLCVRQGYLSSKGDSIICLPNRIVVETIDEERIDAVIR